MQKFKVFYNKHKYQDLSDTPISSSKVISAENAENAELALADLREKTNINGIYTVQNNRYYIGLIHFNSTILVQ